MDVKKNTLKKRDEENRNNENVYVAFQLDCGTSMCLHSISTTMRFIDKSLTIIHLSSAAHYVGLSVVIPLRPVAPMSQCSMAWHGCVDPRKVIMKKYPTELVWPQLLVQLLGINEPA